MPDLRESPYYSRRAEVEILSTLLIRPEACADRVVGALKPEDFGVPSHRVIFKACQEIEQSGRLCDVVAVHDELKAREQLDLVQGGEYLEDLADLVPLEPLVEQNVRLIRDYARGRELVNLLESQMTELGVNAAASLDERLKVISGAVYRLMGEGGRQGPRPVKAILRDVTDAVEAAYQGKGDVFEGLPSGFERLDEIIFRFPSSAVTVIGARPSHGKSAFMKTLALKWARSGVGVLVFSCEDTEKNLALRMLGGLGKLDCRRLRDGQLTDETWPAFMNACDELHRLPIFIDETPGISIEVLRARAKKMKADEGLGAVLVDYLQLMGAPARAGNREQEVAILSRGLRELSKDLGVPVVVLSQLNRGGDGKAPQLRDLRESGAIEQDADLVLLLYQQFKVDGSRPGEVDVIVAKNKHGETGKTILGFNGPSMHFYDFQPWRGAA